MSHPAERMSRVDTAWLRMDNDVNLMMIIGVWLLTPAITLAALRERIEDKLLKYPRFRQKAVADSKKLPERPSNDVLLQLYALYKQATDGDVEGKRPGFTDMVGRAKYDAWAAIKGTANDAAMTRYIELISSLKD